MQRTIIYDRDAGLRQGISQAGSALGGALQQRGLQAQAEEQRQKLQQEQLEKTQEYGTILSETLGSLPEGASSLDMAKAYSSAIERGLPFEVAQSMGSLQKALQKPTVSGGLGFEKRDDLVDLLSRFGMPDEQAQMEADLYLALPQGGKTAYANMFFDRMQRGQIGSPSQPQRRQDSPVGMQNPGGPVGDVSDVEQAEVAGFQFPEIDIFQGLTPKEKVATQKDLFNANAKSYAELNTKRRGYEDELRRFGQMERLNDSGKLPTGLERLNINWTTGDIRVPALANPETQLFVKEVNDFTTKAKDTYGSRVTNFELGTFMRRLPTLSNTEEGRRMILEQMKVNTAIDKLHQDSLAEVYDQYGLRGIDSQKAEVVARDLRKDDEAALLKQYNDVLKSQEIFEARQMAPEGLFPVKKPDGTIGYVPTNKVDEFKKRGYIPL
jgi:hypothetical protein